VIAIKTRSADSTTVTKRRLVGGYLSANGRRIETTEPIDRPRQIGA
jgi:hypothetical protein